MKTSKFFAPLIFVLLVVLSFGLWTAKNIIVKQNTEINSLQERVENLETIATYEYLLPAGYKLPKDAI